MSRLVTAGEIKNWFYCQRVVYYRRKMAEASQATFKMEEALRAQDLIERLETRRTLAAYSVEDYERRFGIWLSSPEIGASGKLDLLLIGPSEAIPVDFKLTAGDPGENLRMQLALYAALVADRLGLPVRRGFLYRIPDDRLFEVRLGPDVQAQAVAAVEEVRRMEEEDFLPEPTPVRRRCTDCEYANFCGDIW
ncbi:MAG: CRISPR-associated protein Cas4 [Bryobacteraceae bacterium]|nr:CRISPR-associated protein Cas4 [Bryobacteraceae bacterium]